MICLQNVDSCENFKINLQEFERLRKKMIRTAMLLGMDHPDVLKYSQELDKLHNILLKKQLQEQS
ncbi:aspartyl-phosphate phosphatase Spo0E family protein [Bacillus taeanensis]|uniref:Aspartyl-phosphate phosphatase Spo0E family protein n=1 Tax=Bacillus taeanensis TaxID=273032 RepID=A0A366Y517_9BACI|nr:aspartyl-phosphate phosphatase Spo0E family protein [Bacillus taeanensis]RBW71301.1 aspartyl-phosphate phosphatase Spo0E family protein [Bacillus taeanensis]